MLSLLLLVSLVWIQLVLAGHKEPCESVVCRFRVYFDANGNAMNKAVSRAAVQIPSYYTCEPDRMIQRKEWRELTNEEQELFYQGLESMKKMPPLGQVQVRGIPYKITNRYDEFVYEFGSRCQHVRGVPSFFPWIRRFLKDFEISLQAAIHNSSFALPYWDWSVDSQAPERSPLLQPDTFGTVGHGCITNGRFENWTTPIALPQKMGRTCIMRTKGEAVPAFYPTEVLKAVIKKTTDYYNFYLHMVTGPYGNVPNSMGGDMSTKFSLNDPLFILHLSQMDRLWTEWQRLNETRFRYDYNGIIPRKWPKRDLIADPTQKMTVLGMKYRIASVLNPRYIDLCYDYSPGITRQAPLHQPHLTDPLHLSQPPPQSLNAYDRKDPFYLRTPLPLEEKWYEFNKLKPKLVQVMEERLGYVVNVVNNMIYHGEHVSMASLYHSISISMDQGLPWVSRSGFWDETGFDSSLEE